MRLIAALSVLTLVAAQGVHVVEVGSTQTAPGGIFQFIPSSLNATANTTITFRFTGAPGNHSVTQSAFADPCNPIPGGFDSGWVFIPPSNVSTAPEWNLTITNSSIPIWFFCKQLIPGPHCSSGMVGAINAPTTGNHTFEAFQQAAAAFKGPSGQGEGGLVGLGASASAFPSPIPSGASLATGKPVGSAVTAGSPPGPSGTGSGTSGALTLSVNSGFMLLAAALGIVLA